jgi:uncharacterized SAM-dependent methyltransferase
MKTPLQQKQRIEPRQSSVDFTQDALDMFLGNRHGHMGKWEYGASTFKGDPSGGAELWAYAIKSPGQYYPAQDERRLLHTFITSQDQKSALLNTRTIVELGPGSDDAIIEKTLPFLSLCPSAERYVAIDSSIEQASAACQIIERLQKMNTKAIQSDFAQDQFKRTWEGPATYIMWGCTIGNLSGFAGQNPYLSLVAEIRQLQKSLLKGDTLVLIFDTNDHEQTVLNAYNEPALKRQSLSWLYALKRDGITTGNFDPRLWVHEPVWFPEMMQCAHTIFPLFDQKITISGHTIKIPAWRRFVANNSYKFYPDVMIAAAEDVGLKAHVIQQGPMAMLIAEK